MHQYYATKVLKEIFGMQDGEEALEYEIYCLVSLSRV